MTTSCIVRPYARPYRNTPIRGPPNSSDFTIALACIPARLSRKLNPTWHTTPFLAARSAISLVWALFGAYGIYYGLSDGVFRAYIADLVEPDYRATAYGIFNTGIGLALVPASVIFGTIWDAFGSKWAFLVSAGFSMLGFVVFLSSMVVERGRK